MYKLYSTPVAAYDKLPLVLSIVTETVIVCERSGLHFGIRFSSVVQDDCVVCVSVSLFAVCVCPL